MNRQSQTANKGWSSSLEVGRGTNNSSLKMPACYEMSHRALDLDLRVLWTR